jgi:hypothetical protein
MAAVSLCNVGYEAVTNYRNSQVSGCERYAAEILYLTLIPVGALEITARIVVAVVIKGVFFVACFIPFNFINQPLNTLQNSFDWIRDSATTCITATAASALSLKNNLMSAGPLDAGAQKQTVEKRARKYLLTTGVPAKPFSMIAFKALTNWRNDSREETGICKKIIAVPLYLGVAALSALETAARTVHFLAVAALYSPLLAGFVILMVTPLTFAFGLIAPSAIHPIVHWISAICAYIIFAGLYISMGYGLTNFVERMMNGGHARWIFEHVVGVLYAVLYSTAVAGAVLIDLKNILSSNDHDLVDHKKQVDVIVQRLAFLNYA